MDHTDILLIGAGPIGLEMSAVLKHAAADYVHIEAGVLGQTIWSLWPRNTEFLSAPDDIALTGVPIPDVRQYRVLNETYLAYLRTVVRVHGLAIRTHSRLVELQRRHDHWQATLSTPSGHQQALTCRRLILATGDMHQPARLGVPGEDLPHVYHAYRDIHEFFGRRVLVIGDGNGAVETALRCVRMGCDVSLSCWDDDLPWDRISHKFRSLLRDLIDDGRLRLLRASLVESVDAEGATLVEASPDHRPEPGTQWHVPANAVIIQVGYRADTRLMQQAGIDFRPDGFPVYDEQTMETTSSGVYLAGTAVAAGRPEFPVFIHNGHAHIARIARAMGLALPSWVKD
jgi:thioredoxin reductase (NADPH)